MRDRELLAGGASTVMPALAAGIYVFPTELQ